MDSTTLRTWRPMLSVACAVACLALAFPTPAARVQDRTHLTANDVLSMPGKTMAITLHAPTPYVRMDRGAMWSGILVNPALAQVKVPEFPANNGLIDPSVTARDLLATALRDAHGIEPRPVDTATTGETKPKKLAALHPDVDFVLAVRTLLWQHAEVKKRGYARIGLEFQLVNVATRHTDAWMRCDIAVDSLVRPGEEGPLFTEMESDGGRTLRHAFSVQAARCARKFAMQRLLISPEEMPQLVALADRNPYDVPPATSAN